MGERGNIVFHGEDVEGIVFYTHWRGYELGKTLAAALDKRWRWDDPPYLLRIIFDTLTEGNQNEESGFGISMIICDNNYPILHIDTDKQLICLSNTETTVRPEGHKWISYEEAIKQGASGELDKQKE